MTREEYLKLEEEWSERPNWEEVFKPIEGLSSRTYPNGYECKCHGMITYKGSKYPLYSDSYGMQNFIVYRFHNEKHEIKEYEIQVENISGMLDWWYELNRMRYEYPEEVKNDNTNL